MAPETPQRNIEVTSTPTGLDLDRIKADFPILEERVNGHKLVYLDNAATTQKPRVVINSLIDYYRRINSNIHRGLHSLAEQATDAFEKTRVHTANFLGGVPVEEVIFTKGSTESLNLVAYAWGEQNIKEGDEIVITEMEHHANFVPWVVLAKRKNAVIKRFPITVCGHLDLTDIDSIITSKTKLVAVSHVSNVLGTINPIPLIARKAKEVGAVVVIDGAQAAPHMAIRPREYGVDFYAFSAHKMLGPTGVGVLWGRRDLLEEMTPFQFGGEMIREVSFERITFNELPWKFEAGTPNIADVIAFDAALTYLEQLGMSNVRQHEMGLTKYTIDRLGEISGLEIQGPLDPVSRGGAISFTDPNIHPHDISTFLDSKGIAIRAGHHCAQPLMRSLGKVATARASVYIYNTESDIDALHDALLDMRKYFGV